MRRFHLHMINAVGRWLDEAGHLLPDLEAARAEAEQGVRSFVGEEAKQGKIDLRGRIEITDEAGAVLQVLPFADAFELHVGEAPG